MKRLPQVFIGVDPGRHGGLAAIIREPRYLEEGDIEPRWEETYKFSSMLGPVDLAIWLQEVKGDRAYALCLEKVGGFQGDEQKDKGSNMFQFGRNYGQIEAAIHITGLTLIEVHPRTWQSALGVKTRAKGETDTQFKQRLKRMAIHEFPSLVVTNDTADALLIALYCKRTYGDE